MILFSWTFLGLNAGFWIIGLPLVVIWVLSDIYAKDKYKNTLNELEDFLNYEDIDELELYPIEFKINREEKWKIGQVLKREEYNSIDQLIRNSLHEIIE